MTTTKKTFFALSILALSGCVIIYTTDHDDKSVDVNVEGVGTIKIDKTNKKDIEEATAPPVLDDFDELDD